MIILTLFFLIILLIFPKDVSATVSQSLFICLREIIPSLFPFSVISGLLAGLFSGMKIPFFTLISRLFNISEKSVWAYLTGLLCGYPIGGKLVLELYEKGDISEKEKDRLLIFANNPGPGFIMGVIGTALFKSVRAGVIIYISFIITSVIFGILTRKKSQKTVIIPIYKGERKRFFPLLAKSIKDSIEAVISITGVICFFSSVSAIINKLSLPYLSLFTGLLEMTGGVYNIYSLTLPLKLKASLCAFIIGFSGVCVFMQLKVISDKIKTTAYFSNKLLYGALCALITYILM